MGTGTIRAVFFDVGGTLLRPAYDLAAVIEQEAAVDALRIDPGTLAGVPSLVSTRLAERARSGRPFTFPAGASEAFWTGIYAEVLRASGPPDRVAPVARRIYDRLASPRSYACYRDTLPALRDLAGRGYALGVISNWESWLHRLLDQAALRPLLAQVIVSAAVEIEKPDPRIFRLAVDATGLRPGQIAYVGDNPLVDAAAARDAGLVPILVRRDDAAPAAGGPADAFRVVTNLTGLGVLLDGVG